MKRYEPFLQTAIKAAVAAGNVLIERYDDVLRESQKESLRDVVTEVDRLAEGTVVSHLQAEFPQLPILGEESGVVGAEKLTAESTFWVVDALDGTVNYVNHVPFFCVSIAYVDRGKTAVGVIYNPLQQDLYYGAQNLGVYKNQSRMATAPKSFHEGLYAVAFSGEKGESVARQREFLVMGAVNDATRGCLRTGSAAMNLAYVAEGRFAGCWSKASKHWDVAAGLLLAELSGAVVQSRFIDDTRRKLSYVVAAPTCATQLFDQVSGLLG